MLTNNQIAKGKRGLNGDSRYLYAHDDHEHRDCIRIAYSWLDAQLKTSRYNQGGFVDKHLIENWAGRYISISDVIVAASMHPEIEGIYPKFNISKRRVYPCHERLIGIKEAYKHDYDEHSQQGFKDRYMYFELDNGRLETVSRVLNTRINTDSLYKNIRFKH